MAASHLRTTDRAFSFLNIELDLPASGLERHTGGSFRRQTRLYMSPWRVSFTPTEAIDYLLGELWGNMHADANSSTVTHMLRARA
jgi:hypothetical protein